MTINKTILETMYKKMFHVRKFEEKVAHFFSMGMVHGTTHLYVGEEATGVGACSALEDKDLITSTHRGHGHCIGKGIDLNRMMAELLGKATGYCKGKGGSMHIADLSRGNLGANGVVGGGMPIAVGAGLTVQMKKLDQVVVCFFGDGAANEGSFHESLNLASVWNLPIIFICENNLYGMSVPTSKSMKIQNVADRAAAYGIPGKIIDGNDVIAVYNTVMEAKTYVKKNGPMLIEAKTYRWMGHSKSDANVYRSREEIAAWRERCPIQRLKKYLTENGISTTGELDAIEKQATEEIEQAVEFAQASPYPSIDTIMEDVYA
ncbi:thiamine pyrophosphate-dependent dehydrogenase E1 component subunit alpha [Geosporobacter ferrireducens]|uniref:Pyruvate dehydrogenase n=1 Tax=Geosporobacter ferrireducens TaxID=1424294 RepID=A0A1D8GJP9_9FIRM|nr:thiamine pyrophosphate-dependent dehydrogenase E1 component subunit alpha [Geosporobacter ferrireducens]AOT71137.1 pyruvate dehydrogenase [Geosporobacter ferrireducens]MTI57945.1 thiamine pyrophosphate-dependent dehydrogenase E1 component subunit alpha [Geosporobacter ferrireducens]